MTGKYFKRLNEYLRSKSQRVRVMVVGIMLAFFFFIVVPVSIAFVGSVLGFASFVGPQKYVSILYPSDKMEVPPEFNVVCVSAFHIGGVIDHSPRLFDETSKINLNVYGMKGSLSVDGKEVGSSRESGTMHVFRLGLEEGNHILTFSTFLGSESIEVIVKGTMDQRLTEVSDEEISHINKERKAESCRISMYVDKEHLYTRFKGRTRVYSFKDISTERSGARIVYPYDAKTFGESSTCEGDYAAAVFVERVETSPGADFPAKFHHFLVIVHGEKLSVLDLPRSYSEEVQDIKIHLTGRGTLLVNDGSGHVFCRKGSGWKRLYIPVATFHANRDVYSCHCGGAQYDPAAERYLLSSGVSFKPCTPRFEIIAERGNSYIHSRAVADLFKKKVYRIQE